MTLTDKKQFQQLFHKINALLGSKERVVVAVDGMSGAGKSSLAELLKDTYSCNVISMDHFFLRPEQRTTERLAEPGGNIDYERFNEQVLAPLMPGKPFAYRPYDCGTLTLSEPVNVDLNPITVIEGVYSMHPSFANAHGIYDAYDTSVFLEIEEDVQRQRLLKRSPHLYERFINEWIPMENMYFERFKIPDKCELRFDSRLQ